MGSHSSVIVGDDLLLSSTKFAEPWPNLERFRKSFLIPIAKQIHRSSDQINSKLFFKSRRNQRNSRVSPGPIHDDTNGNYDKFGGLTPLHHNDSKSSNPHPITQVLILACLTICTCMLSNMITQKNFRCRISEMYMTDSEIEEKGLNRRYSHRNPEICLDMPELRESEGYGPRVDYDYDHRLNKDFYDQDSDQDWVDPKKRYVYHSGSVQPLERGWSDVQGVRRCIEPCASDEDDDVEINNKSFNMRILCVIFDIRSVLWVAFQGLTSIMFIRLAISKNFDWSEPWTESEIKYCFLFWIVFLVPVLSLIFSFLDKSTLVHMVFYLVGVLTFSGFYFMNGRMYWRGANTTRYLENYYKIEEMKKKAKNETGGSKTSEDVSNNRKESDSVTEKPQEELNQMKKKLEKTAWKSQCFRKILVVSTWLTAPSTIIYCLIQLIAAFVEDGTAKSIVDNYDLQIKFTQFLSTNRLGILTLFTMVFFIGFLNDQEVIDVEAGTETDSTSISNSKLVNSESDGPGPGNTNTSQPSDSKSQTLNTKPFCRLSPHGSLVFLIIVSQWGSFEQYILLVSIARSLAGSSNQIAFLFVWNTIMSLILGIYQRVHAIFFSQKNFSLNYGLVFWHQLSIEIISYSIVFQNDILHDPLSFIGAVVSILILDGVRDTVLYHVLKRGGGKPKLGQFGGMIQDPETAKVTNTDLDHQNLNSDNLDVNLPNHMKYNRTTANNSEASDLKDSNSINSKEKSNSNKLRLSPTEYESHRTDLISQVNICRWNIQSANASLYGVLIFTSLVILEILYRNLVDEPTSTAFLLLYSVRQAPTYDEQKVMMKQLVDSDPATYLKGSENEAVIKGLGYKSALDSEDGSLEIVWRLITLGILIFSVILEHNYAVNWNKIKLAELVGQMIDLFSAKENSNCVDEDQYCDSDSVNPDTKKKLNNRKASQTQTHSDIIEDKNISIKDNASLRLISIDSKISQDDRLVNIVPGPSQVSASGPGVFLNNQSAVSAFESLGKRFTNTLISSNSESDSSINETLASDYILDSVLNSVWSKYTSIIMLSVALGQTVVQTTALPQLFKVVP